MCYNLLLERRELNAKSDYPRLRRRQLTEAAKLLVFSKKPIIEIALMSDYESQQAFTDIFKAILKDIWIYYDLPRLLKETGVWLAIPIAELLTLMLTICLIVQGRTE